MKKAIILVAGQSTRTFPLTVTRPKALLSVANKPLLSYLLDALVGKVQEVILVVHYKKEMLQEAFGAKYKNMILHYCFQKQTKGTGHAVLCAEHFVATDKEPFLVMVGDDFFDSRDIENLCQRQRAILVQAVEEPALYGVVLANKNNELVSIEEKPKHSKTKVVNTGAYIIDNGIFSFLKKIKKSKRGEYELTDAVQAYARKYPVCVVEAKNWQPVTYPWHLLDLNEKILHQLKTEKNGKIEPGVTLCEPVSIGKGTQILSGTYIEGPVLVGKNCKIGPNCYIRPCTSIGNNVKIGNAVEIKNSIVGDHTNIGHLSYVGDSVIGAQVNFGAGTMIANLRHDSGSVKSEVHNQLIDTQRKKFGAVIGEGVRTGIHTSIYPGRKLWPRTTTCPGEVVQKDKH